MSDKYLDAEKRLAELLGWQDLQMGGRIGFMNVPSTFFHAEQKSGGFMGRELLLQWCRDNAAAFALMVEHAIDLDFGSDYVMACSGRLCHMAEFKDHPDRETAVRYAIVMAVIAKLEAKP